MNPTELIKGKMYNDASGLYPALRTPLKYSHFDKDWDKYVFDRYSQTGEKLWKLYLGELTVQNTVRELI